MLPIHGINHGLIDAASFFSIYFEIKKPTAFGGPVCLELRATLTIHPAHLLGCLVSLFLLVVEVVRVAGDYFLQSAELPHGGFYGL